MTNANVFVTADGQSAAFREVALPIVLGRQRRGDADHPSLREVRDDPEEGLHRRIAIAALEDVSIPRKLVRIVYGPEGMRMVNIHKYSSFTTGTGLTVYPGRDEIIGDSVVVHASANIEIRVELAESLYEEAGQFRTIEGPSLQTADVTTGEFKDLFDGEKANQVGDVAIQLVRQALGVVQKAAGSDEFFDAAVRAAATMIELDRAFVILYEASEWHVRSEYSADASGSPAAPHGDALPRGSGLLRRRVLDEKKTVLYEPANYTHSTDSSMMALDRAVAAPMLDDRGEVIGVLYGDRRPNSARSDQPIGDFEATLLDIIASAVASGLARQRQEAMRASMTQFFSPSVTERLQVDNNLLTGRDAKVTVLFCDIRGFSAISERVGPIRTIEWINDVLTELSHCVLETDGVLVDYVGDELMAMWGAPTEQPDHASRACDAAVRMLEKAELLRARWREITPDRFGFGIGINSGLARVGNTGSKLKFKYGPLGPVVNVASRIQGMTKHFGVPALIGSSTFDALPPTPNAPRSFGFRKIADVRPVGVQEVVTLYQLNNSSDRTWTGISRAYEKALAHYYENNLTEAARELASLVHVHPEDAPSVRLLGRVVRSLTDDETVDPVIEFDRK